MSQILEIQRKLKEKELSCTELTKEYLSAIEQENDDLIAYVHLCPEEALSAAAKVDEKIAKGEELSPLEGVPMTLKDNISTTGIETTCCSKILEGYKPIYDATVWEKLKGNGAVLLGKTNMDEFAMGSSCETSCYGGAKNPYNHNHVSGGSSGGVAAAVGARLAAYGLGSDTGGSIRQPAGFCGLVGLKPTYGAVSRYGLIAYASSLDQIGPIAANVTDAALVYDAIAGFDERDSTSMPTPETTADGLSQSVKGMKIGICEDYFKGVRKEVSDAVYAAAETYRSMGAEIVSVSLPSLSYALPVYYILACAEASSNLGRYDSIRYGYRTKQSYLGYHEMICKTRSEGFGKEVQRRILLGTYVLSAGYYDAYYKKAQKLRGRIVGDFAAAFETCDLLLAPTVPMTAFPCGFTAQDAVETYQTDICTVPVNIAGIPAVSIPCGFDSTGLPIGMQLIGGAFTERRLLNAAYQFEQATDGQFLLQTKTGVLL